MTPDADGDDGRYADPEDYPADGCAPGGFAGVEVEGIYHVEVDWAEGFTFALPFRFDREDDGWSGEIGGRLAGYADVDDDAAILHSAGESGSVRAVYLCARDAEGTIDGYYAICPPTDQGEECYVLGFRGKKLEPLDEPAASGLRLLGSYGPWVPYDEGITVNVRVAGDLAYLARYQDGLRIVDISDPANIVARGHQPVEFPDDGEIYNDVKLLEWPKGSRYAVMASSVVGAVVVDVTDPAAPSIVAHFGSRPAPGEPIDVHTLFLVGNRAYITVRDLGLEIWDLSTPTAPVRLGGFQHPAGDAYLHDLSVHENRAYLNFWSLGMAIVDVSDPAAPDLLGSFVGYGEDSSHSNWVTEIGGRKIAVHGDEQWGSHVHVVDVTEGTDAFTTSIAEWETRPEVSLHNVMAAGDRAYLAYYQDGIRVLDLSDPTQPSQVAHYQTWPGYDRAYGRSFFEGAIGLDLDLARGRIYVADSHRGLLILELEE